MSQDACILTTKDLTILEVMLDRCMGRDDPMAPLLRRKIESALIVFRGDVSEIVATLNSRVRFAVDDGHAQTRVLSHDPMHHPNGLFLPITSPRGLALLGVSEGQSFRLPVNDGSVETLRLEKVLYQPEKTRRERERTAMVEPSGGRRPQLKLIRGAHYGRAHASVAAEPDGYDDPGPSAA